MKELYDVIIIGSGQASLAAAVSCNSFKLNVLIIAGDMPENEQIVESIHPGVLSLYNHLGIKKIPSHCIAGTYNYLSNGINFNSLNPYTSETWTGIHIYKNKFQLHTIEYCKKLGISISLSEKARKLSFDNNYNYIKTDTNYYRSKFVIDCSGAKRFVGHNLKLKTYNHSKTYIAQTGFSAGLTGKTLNDNIAYFLKQDNGWLWISKLNDDRFYWTRLFEKQKLTLNSYLDNLISPTLLKSSNQTWFNFNIFSVKNFFLCGDAAYNIDPALGQGILNALKQGIMASAIIYETINNPDKKDKLSNSYNMWMDNELQTKREALNHQYKEYQVFD